MGKFCKPSCNSERSIFFLFFFLNPSFAKTWLCRGAGQVSKLPGRLGHRLAALAVVGPSCGSCRACPWELPCSAATAPKRADWVARKGLEYLGSVR